jgi:hypothetical protein
MRFKPLKQKKYTLLTNFKESARDVFSFSIKEKLHYFVLNMEKQHKFAKYSCSACHHVGYTIY